MVGDGYFFEAILARRYPLEAHLSLVSSESRALNFSLAWVVDSKRAKDDAYHTAPPVPEARPLPL
jgi:hypothetical protein